MRNHHALAGIYLIGVLWTSTAHAQTADPAFYDNRYAIFTANNYGLRKGEAYYQNSMLLFNQAYFGFSDAFSCGFGIVPSFLFGGGTTPAWLNPRFHQSIAPGRFAIGGGAFIGGFWGENLSGLNFIYVSATAGSPGSNVSLHTGRGVFGRRFAGKTALGISGMHHFKSHLSLIAENYFADDIGIASMGLRLKRKKITIDGVVILPVIEGEVFELLPWFSLIVPFRINMP
ncbi:MAG: hypothetical protein ACK4NS_05910 [Saprospiraceae bacterium]